MGRSHVEPEEDKTKWRNTVQVIEQKDSSEQKSTRQSRDLYVIEF